MPSLERKKQSSDSHSVNRKSTGEISSSRFFGKTMLKQFLTMYLVLIVFYFFLTRLVEPGIHNIFYEDIIQDKVHDYETVITLLTHLYPTKNEDEWSQLIQDINLISNVPVQTMALNLMTLPPEAMEHIAKGYPTLPYYPEDIHFQLIAPNVVAKVGPMGINNNAEFAYFILEGAPIILLGGFSLLWVVGLQFRLVKLENIASAYSRGNFDVKATTGFWAIGDLNRVFNYMAERLHRLFQSQKQLTNAVSHELRSPISRLRFQLEMMAESKDQKLKAKYLAGMEDDLDEMDELIHELLTFTRLESTEPLVTFEQVDISTWLQNQQQYLLTEISSTISLVIPDLVSTMAMNSQLMARLLRNLVINADKYADQSIIIGASIEGANYHIWVDDDGPGIPKDKEKYIFQPFTRLDTSRNKDTGGYGLGLAIVAQIARQHYGKVTIEKSELGGARMLMAWPLPKLL